MTVRLCIFFLVWPILAAADPVLVPPRPVPSGGTVIKPVGRVDPGIVGKAPVRARFPMPVIKPENVTPVAPK